MPAGRQYAEVKFASLDCHLSWQPVKSSHGEAENRRE